MPTEADAYADLIRDWLDQEVVPDDYDDFSKKDVVKKHRASVTIADVWTLAMENAPKLTQTDSRQVGAALRLCGAGCPTGSGAMATRRARSLSRPRTRFVAGASSTRRKTRPGSTGRARAQVGLTGNRKPPTMTAWTWFRIGDRHG